MGMVGLPEEMIAGMRQSPYWAQGEALAPTLAYDAAAMGDGDPPDRRARPDHRPDPRARRRREPGVDARVGARAAAAAIPGARPRYSPGQTHDVAADALAAAVRDVVTAYADRP